MRFLAILSSLIDCCCRVMYRIQHDASSTTFTQNDNALFPRHTNPPTPHKDASQVGVLHSSINSAPQVQGGYGFALAVVAPSGADDVGILHCPPRTPATSINSASADERRPFTQK